MNKFQNMKIFNSSIHNLIKFNISVKSPVFTTISISIVRKGAMGLIAISIFRKEEEEALSSQVLNAVEAEDKDKRGLVHAIGVFIKTRFIRAIIATRSNLDPARKEAETRSSRDANAL